MKLSNEDAANWFGNLVSVAVADGRLNDEEHRVLLALALRFGVAPDEAEAAMQAALDGATEFDLPGEPDGALELLRECVAIAALDGELAGSEREMCHGFAMRLGLGRDAVDAALAKVRGSEGSTA